MADLQRTRRLSILTSRGVNRALIGMFLAALLTWCTGAVAAASTDLHRIKVTVTGRGEANRNVGFAAALEDVLIKASGAQSLVATGDWPPTRRRPGITSGHSATAISFLANLFVTSRVPGIAPSISWWTLRKAGSTTFSRP
jgi:hypothetical protein